MTNSIHSHMPGLHCYMFYFSGVTISQSIENSDYAIKFQLQLTLQLIPSPIYEANLMV
jgi:hypothetical protein